MPLKESNIKETNGSERNK